MKVDDRVAVASGYAWRLLVIAGAAVAGMWLVARLWIVLVALVVALLLTRVLVTPAARLKRRLPAGLAAALSLVGLLVLVSAVLAGVSAAIAGEVSELGPTISAAVDDLEDWLVEDSPFDIDRRDVDDFRETFGERVSDGLRDSSGSIVSGAFLAAEVFVSFILALVLTFFALKDGDRFVTWARSIVPAAHRDRVDRMGSQAWMTLGAFLRGAAVLGVVEGAIVTVTLLLVGTQLAVPMGVLTFLAAFVPFVGAIVAGFVSVLVALATGGVEAAAIVLVVVVVVQQLDNDLLAPVVYGRALQLHPVVVLLSITAGGALFGIPGSVLAVPVTAVVWNVIAEGRRDGTAPSEATIGTAPSEQEPVAVKHEGTVRTSPKTREELYDEAKRKNLPGRSKMGRAELARALGHT